MIFHNCIKCDHFEMIKMNDKPVMQKYKCPKCRTIQYILHSKLSPETYSEDMVVVDEKNRSIKFKSGGR